jgi:branched-chain amino acid transport system substrate-binding protein
MEKAKALVTYFSLISLLFMGSISGWAEEIKIGALSDLTGPTAAGIGEDYGWGCIDFWRYVNEVKGGISGHKVKFLLSDNQYKPSLGLAAIKKFAAQDQVVAIHLYGAGETVIYKPTFLEIKIPGISAQSANCTNEYIFLDQGTYGIECWAAMDYVKRDHKGSGKPRMALLVLANSFGRSVIPGAKWYAEKIGIDLAVIEDVSLSIVDAKPILLRLKAKGIRYIYHNNVSRPVATMLKDAKAIGYDAKHMAMSYCGESVLLKLAGEAVDGFIVSTSLAEFQEPTMDFPRMLFKRYREGQNFPSNTYGSGIARGMIFEEAIKRSLKKYGKVDGQKVKEAMETLKDFSLEGIVPNVTFGPDRRVPSFSKRLLQASWDRKRFSSITDFVLPTGIKGMKENEVERLLEKFERFEQ